MRPAPLHRPTRRPRATTPLLVLVAAALALSGCSASVGGAAVSPASSPAVASSEISTADPTTGTADSTGATDAEPAPTTAPETTSTGTTSTGTTSTETTSTGTTDTGTTTSTEPSEPAELPTLAFGQSFTWANGIEVTVTAPQKYTPKDAEDAKEYGKEFVSFTITVANGSKQAYQASDLLFRAGIDSQSAGRRYYDGDLPSTPEISMVPGQSATWTLVYGLSSTRTIAAVVAADSDSEEIGYALDGTGTTGRESGRGDPLQRFIGVQKLGGSYTFASGVQVAVGAFRAYSPGADAYGEESPRYLQTSITVTNGSRETISPTTLSYGLAEKTQQRVEVRARSQKIGTLPEGRYPPGSKFTVKVAFGVQSTAGLVVDVRLRDSGSVVFTDLAVPVYSSKEPGASTPTRPSSGGTSTGPVADEIAVRGKTQVTFGSKITWANGVTAVVGKPATFAPQNVGSRQPRGARAIKYTVTITNGSKEPITSIVGVTAVSGGFSCDSIADAASGVGDPELSVEPGKSATLTLGCWAKDPGDVVVQLRPDQPYDEAWASSTAAGGPRSVTVSKEAESDSAERTFGQTFVYASRISLTVKVRTAIEVGSVAGEGKTYLAVEGTFTNNTNEPFRLTGWSPKVFDGDAAAETFDNARDWIGPVSGLYLLPGRSITLAQGVIVTDPAKISVTNRDPSFDGPTITWTR